MAHHWDGNMPAGGCLVDKPSVPPYTKLAKSLSVVIMPLTEDFIRSEFAPWESENPVPFFDKLSDNVSWTISGKLNPCAGVYNSKAAVIELFGKLMSKLSGPPICKITNVLTAGDYAVVEMDFHSVSKGGIDFDQQLCWVCRYEGKEWVMVRLYVDTAGEVRLFAEP
jgi:uncharacterized protein